MYREDLGYIDIDTLEPLVLCSNCDSSHPVQYGKLRFKDSENNGATLSFNNELKFNLNFVDASQVETSRSADWREMNSWVLLNNPPGQGYVYIDAYPSGSQDIVIEVSDTYDPEDDELTAIVTWRVNGSIIEGNTGTTLSHEHFNANDTIEVSVVMVDPFGAQSPPFVRTVTINNAAPNIVINGAKTYTLGQLMTLDASDSSDPDGHLLTFNWEIGGYPKDLVTIVSPDKAKTEVRIQSNGDYLFSLDVGENINGELSDETYLKNASVTVLPEDLYRESEELPDNVGFVTSLQILDVLGDDKPEVVTARPGRLQILNFANRSDNREVYLYDSSYSPHTVLAEDLNNDGLIDFIVDQEEGFAVSKQEAGGYFNGFPSHHISQTPFHHTINKIQSGHFNDDNKLDVAVLFNTSVEVYLQKEPEPPIPDIPEDEDIVLDDDDTAFESPIVYKFTENSSITPFESTEMKVADVTGDSLDDIVLITPLDNNSHYSLALLKQKSAGGFEEKEVIHPEIQYTKDDTLALVDLNGDQRLDILATHSQASNALYHGAFDIFYQSSAGDFNEFETRTTSSDIRKIIVKDINNDGINDLVMNSDNIFTVQKQTTEELLSPFFNVYEFAESANAFGVGDINADGKLDAVSTSFGRMYVRYGK